MDVQTLLTALFSALGGGTLATIFKQVWDWGTGRSGRKRSEVDRAHEKADRERRKRIRVEDSLMVHRRVIREAPCLTETHMPPYPQDPDLPATGPIDTKEP